MRETLPLSIVLPKSGGALSGFGEKFSPDLHTGTGNFTVPIVIPPGRGGFQPNLNLTYSSGLGNGAFGLGWGLSVAGIARLTTRGVPRYLDTPGLPDTDTFVLAGAEDLVELPPDAESGPNVKRYRPRTEQLFARIERRLSNASDYWTVRTKDGLTHTYGSADPAVDCTIRDPSAARKVFAWRLTESRDPFGNRIAFTYRRDQMQGTRSWDQLYLRSIRYVDLVGPGQAPFLISIELVYDDEPTPSGLVPSASVRSRPDPFSDYRAGFEIRTRARCKWLVVRTHPSAAASIPVRAYELTYLDETESDVSKHPLNATSLLAQLHVIGFDDAGTAQRELPPLDFSYSHFAPSQQRLIQLTGTALPLESLGHPDVELVDLFGNGLPDLLEFGETVRYWRNLGDGRFDRPREMSTAPAGLRLSNSGVQMLDADGDGRADLLVTEGATAGYFPMDFGAEWNVRSFRRYDRAPSFSLKDPEVRLLDLTGDGIFDALRTGTRLECYFNDRVRGWLPENNSRIERGTLDNFPDVNCSDPRVKLADMSGDGLQDIVLVHAGRIDYWPNLGHGRWGARLTLAIPGRLPFDFDPERVLLGDVDGDGAADLLYIADREISLWINRCGNGLSPAYVVRGTPTLTSNDMVHLVDLLGTGVAGVLWSRAADGSGRPQHFFLDLTGGVKPALLVSIDNNLGAITQVIYRSSTTFFLRDQAARETRWRTTLPFPVQVVERVTTRDTFSGGTLTSEFRYHHGYWDGAEREFRGFGMVERIDTEVLDGYNGRNLSSNDATFQRLLASGQAPTLTRTWFHLGPVERNTQGEWSEIDWSNEYSTVDPHMLRHTELANAFLDTLPLDARRDALRALRGTSLRSELFALDGSTLQDRPYTVDESAYGLREIEPPPVTGSGRQRIFTPLASAQRSTQWERGTDPLTQFTVQSAYDDVGQPARTVIIACPRGWRRMTDTPTAPYLATLTHRQFADSWPAGIYIRDRVVRERKFELTATTGRTVAQLAATTEASTGLRMVTEVRNYYDFTADATTGYGAFVGLPFAAIGPFGALVRSEALVMTPEDVQATYGGNAPPYLTPGAMFAPSADYPAEFVAALPTLAGYTYYPASATNTAGYFATTLAQRYDFHDGGGIGRGLVVAQRDPLGNEISADYDFGLLPIRTRDPLGLETAGSYDRRTLLPNVVTDPNGNVTRVTYSPMGLVTDSFVAGKPNALAIDRRNAGDRTVASVHVEYDFFAYMRSRTAVPPSLQPISTRAVRRVYHDSDPDDTGETIEAREYSDGFGRLLQTRTQGDDIRFGDTRYGGGDPFLPSSQQLSPPRTITGVDRQNASLRNVTVTGWKRYDNKGQVIEQYEPYWSEGWDFVLPTAAQQREKTTTAYDSRGRVIATIFANGAEQRVIRGIPIALDDPPLSACDAARYQPSPWEVFVYDANDNASRTHSADARIQDYRHHWNTPSSMETDAMGRTVATVARYRDTAAGAAIETYTTRTQFDIQGKALDSTDPLGRTALRYTYDHLGRALLTESIDSGRQTVLLDAAGDTLEQNDAKGARQLHAYDASHRLTRRWARDDANDTLTLRERIVYGDDTSVPGTFSERQANNLRGRPWLHQDEAGEAQTDSYDFKGNALVHVRRVLSDTFLLAAVQPQAGGQWNLVAPRVDWAASTPPDLDPRSYVTRNEVDALGRIKWSEYPRCANGERYRIRPSFNRAGSLSAVSLIGPLDANDVGPVTPYVSQISYNARGQRLFIAYANGLLTRYAYDDKTTQLTRIRTEWYASAGPSQYVLTGSPIQDIAYDYDLAGNLLRIADRTHGCGVRNSILGANALDREFRYDPLYRLTSATGRECTPLGAARPWTDDPACEFGRWSQGSATPANAPDVTSLYSERYEYDPADNMLALRHTNGANGWTRYFGVSGRTPREWRQLIADWRGGLTVTWGTEGNQLTNVGGGDLDASSSHAFDPCGNLTREHTTRYFEWDHANLMKVYRTQTGTAQPSVYALHVYDSNGHRIKKLVWRGANRYATTVFVGTAFEHQTDVRPSETRTNCSLHVMDDVSRIALVRIGPAFADDGARDQPVQFHLADHLGSSGLVVGADGLTMTAEEFFPHGESSFGGFARKRYRYIGALRDEESGLHCHGRRYLASWLGRWISPDPAGPVDGLNFYVYARCSPILNRDKSGLETPQANEHHRVCQSCHEVKEEPREDMNMEPLLDQIRNNPKLQMAGGIAMGTAAASVPFIGAAAVGILQQQGYLDRLPQNVQAGIGIGMGATGAVQTIIGVVTMLGGGGIAGGGGVLAPVTGGVSLLGSAAGLGIAAVGALEATAGAANVGVGLFVFAKASGRVPTGRSQWWLRNVRESHVSRSQRGHQVYVLKDRNGTVLYVGKSGGAGGKNPKTWLDRVRAHIKDSTKRDWIGEVDRIDVFAELTEQEAYALEYQLTNANAATAKNIKNIVTPDEYGALFPEGNLSANARSAAQKPMFSFETDIVSGN